MPNDINKLKRLMFAANYLHKYDPVILKGRKLDQSSALRYAWYFERFRKNLSSGVYRFSYFKADGSIREAIGTLDMSRIPMDKRPKGDPSHMLAPAGVCSYFDLGVNAWRSFCIDLFIGFVEEVITPAKESI